MQVSRIGLTEPARLATPLGTNRKPVALTRLRLPTKLVFPHAAAPTLAPARATAPNAPLQARQARQATNRTPPSHTVGHPSSSRVTGQVVHPSSNGTLLGDNKQRLLQRKYNNNTATQRKPAGRAASTFGQNNTSRAKATSAFLSSPLGQNPKCMLKTGSQELQPRARMHTRQSGEAAMALAKPEAGQNAFTFRVSGAPDLASSSKHRAEMPASKPQPTRLAGASPAREVKQPATTTTTAEICAVVDASASLEAMPRRLSVGQGQLMSDPVVSMEECSERLERLLQHVHRANEEKAALKALKLPTTPKKPTLARSSTTSSSNGEADGSRRRAATVGSAERGQNASVRIQLRLEELRARRLARKGDARKAAAKDDSVAMPMSHPTSAIQNKVERLRTRREAREEKDRRAADSCNAAFPMSSSLPVKSKPRANIDSIATREMYRKNSYSGSETATDCTSGADEDGDSTKRSSGFLPMLLDESFKESLVGKGFSNKELSVRMRGSMDRTAPPPHRCDTLVDSTPISEGGEALDQDPKHALSLVKKSDADEQVLSHVVNSSSPSTEQKIAQLIAENRLLKHHVSEARKAIAALTRVVVRMQ